MSKPTRPRVTDKTKTVDLSVYNDSTFLSIWSEPAEKNAPPISSQTDLVERELGIVLPLCQDDPYVMRVRLGTPTAAEKREYVGLASGHMNLKSGLLISGEAAVQVPKKRYRIEIRSYLPHSMACWQIEQADKPREKLGVYYRRTRPDKVFPDWLSYNCWSQPTDDPGHEKEWRKLNSIDLPKHSYVDFVVCLLSPNAKKPVSNVKRNGLIDWETRRPNRCPLGIKAPDIPPNSWEEDEDW